MSEPQFVGDVLRSLRESRRLARLDLQRLSGVSEATIARAERGGTITRRTAERIGRALGVEPERLLAGAGGDR